MRSIRFARHSKQYFALVLIASFCGAVPAWSDDVPVSCTILPDEYTASIVLKNPFNYDASCLATCKFSTSVYDDNPQIICSKSVPAGKEVQMCILKSDGQKLVKFTEGSADCRRK